ncbi:MAG TPA: primosomal protein N' [Burkholderiales bacterium]|nr:primosomal protein N' [Burkholderiales bacterium]
MTILRVALDVPLPRLFDYACAAASASDIGLRVSVPFGARSVVGLIVEVRDATDVPAGKLRDAGPVLRDTPPLPPGWLDLVRFAADYYHRPLGEVIHGALPPRLRRARPLVLLPEAFAVTDGGRAALDALPARSHAKRALLEQLSGGPVPVEALGSSRALRALVKDGLVAPCAAPEATPRLVEEDVLTAAQSTAVAAITGALGRYASFLLLGITGSGKTEVYLHCIGAALARGAQALVLVPEINLTPQLAGQFARRFPGTRVVTLTSAAAENERAAGWLAAQSGAARIVLGTRLAVFAPFARLGLVVVDEEHDASFKQQEGLRYSARDLAVYRAHAARAPVVLGSATPSLESYAHAQAGRYKRLELPERARAGARLPDVQLVDTRTDPGIDGVSTALAAAIDARLARSEQALVFLNRRGYAPVLVCGACGWTGGCPRCTAHLVLHTADRRLRCHHCGEMQPIPRHCPTCGNVDLVPFGRGTQRVEEAIAARFPRARLLRIDSDSTRTKGRWEAMRRAIESGEAEILLGTQILAKGHDFPRVTLVGVLNADAALVAADYRAPERLFAQLYQVAGRAGRADLPGEVLVQTRYPGHPLYQALVRHDFAGFADAQLAERREAGFPPAVHEAALRAESPEMRDALGFLARALAQAPAARDEVTVYDPVPMTLAKLAGNARAQVLLQSPARPALQAFLRDWVATLYVLKPGAVRWHIDVDPLEF